MKVNDLTIVYGTTPTFSVTYTGFIPTEGPGVLTGA